MLWLSSVPYFYQEILAEVWFSLVDSTRLITNQAQIWVSPVSPVESGPVQWTPTGLCGGEKSIAMSPQSLLFQRLSLSLSQDCKISNPYIPEDIQ